MLINNEISKFFDKRLTNLKCQDRTKDYIVGLLCDFSKNNYHNANQSLTLIYWRSNSFLEFQNLADWIFFCEVNFDQHLKDASKEYYYSLAQISYYRCYQLINRQLKIYEQLADELPRLIQDTKFLMDRYLESNATI